jgi:hypothetical protein
MSEAEQKDTKPKISSEKFYKKFDALVPRVTIIKSLDSLATCLSLSLKYTNV